MRRRRPAQGKQVMVLPALACAAVLIATAILALAIKDATRARHVVYGMSLVAASALLVIALLALLGVSQTVSYTHLTLPTKRIV